MSRFDGIDFDDQRKCKHYAIKRQFELLDETISTLCGGGGRIYGQELQEAKLHLEVAFVWVGKALKEQQIGEKHESK